MDKTQVIPSGSTSAVSPVSPKGTPSSGRLVKRAEAARMLGVRVSTLRRKEGVELNPIVDSDGVHMFDESEVRSVMVTVRRSQSVRVALATGDVAADVFEMLDGGAHPVDIVKQLRVGPDVVIALNEQWLGMRGGIAFSVEQAGELARLLQLCAPVSGADDALAKLRQRLNALTCANAGRSYAHPAPPKSRSSLASEAHGPLGTVNVDVERRDGALGAEVRILAGAYWLDSESGDGSVADLHSDWYPVLDLESCGVSELVAAIEGRQRRPAVG